MLRRRPIVVTRRGPGIVGMMARTAVVAGTATAVARGVSGAMSDGSGQAQAEASQAQAKMDQMRPRWPPCRRRRRPRHPPRAAMTWSRSSNDSRSSKLRA
jgi:hypothetical protein